MFVLVHYHALNADRSQHAPVSEKLISGFLQYFTSTSSPQPVEMPWSQGQHLWKTHQPASGVTLAYPFFYLPTLDICFMWPLWKNHNIILDYHWDHCACSLEGQGPVCDWEKFLCRKTSKLFHSKLYLEINILTELLRREITMSTYSMSQKRAGLNSQANKKIIQ